MTILATLVAIAAAPPVAYAQSYPERAVRMIVPFPAGGTTDLVARAMAERLSTGWKQPVVIENIAGATGAIGSAAAARAPRDGYTMIAAVGTTTAILKAMRSDLTFDPIGDFTPVSLIATYPNVLVVRADFPASNVAELISVVKAAPGKFTYASSGHGGTLHLSAELFKLMTATDIVHVPFTGSAPAITALLGGHVDMIFDNLPSIWSTVQSGKLRALGVASPTRIAVAPELPLISEVLPGFDITTWEGILVPAGTPTAVVNRIASDVARIVAEPAFVQSMQKLGAVAASNTPGAFARFIADDYEKWRRVITETGIQRK
jgi:tripartite-type tricarboxylate transporter receptor subunit TctC